MAPQSTPVSVVSESVGAASRRWGGLIAALAVVSALHYTTDPHHAWLHNIYQRLYYAPIVLGAYWFGTRGGIIIAVAAALAYYPHIFHTWGHNVPYAASQYVELTIFPCAGLLVGMLADRQRRLTLRFRDAATSLERANTSLRESQAQLRRADRLSALGEIAAGLAHEIRNPLAAIKGALDIVGARVNDGTTESEFTGIAATELARLDRLVGEFLAYARPREPELRLAPLEPVIDQAISLLRTEADRVGVVLNRRPAGSESCVAMDPEQVLQAVFNIILNAIQAAPRGTAVEVATVAMPRGTQLIVHDHGVGIAEVDRDRIFEPFFTTKARGTGLGLAVSHRIMLAHGGGITVESGPDGTVVTLTFPVREHSCEEKA